MNIKAFFDPQTFTVSYVVSHHTSKDAIIIDPVMNYDQASSSYSYNSVNDLMEYIENNKLKLHYIIETHAHADHLSGTQEIKKRQPLAKTLISQVITEVQKTFKSLFNYGDDFTPDGSQFDYLVSDGEIFKAGDLEIKAIHTPGHTPACASYLIDDAIFTGDALFMPDFGVARCDFPGGNAKTLYHSVTKKLYTLPESTRVFTAHDYQPGGRELKHETSIGDSKKHNIHLNEKTSENDFVEFRTNRDKNLPAPKLLLPSLAININAGRLPSPEANGLSYLKLPIRPI